MLRKWKNQNSSFKFTDKWRKDFLFGGSAGGGGTIADSPWKCDTNLHLQFHKLLSPVNCRLAFDTSTLSTARISRWSVYLKRTCWIFYCCFSSRFRCVNRVFTFYYLQVRYLYHGDDFSCWVNVFRYSKVLVVQWILPMYLSKLLSKLRYLQYVSINMMFLVGIKR